MVIATTSSTLLTRANRQRSYNLRRRRIRKPTTSGEDWEDTKLPSLQCLNFVEPYCRLTLQRHLNKARLLEQACTQPSHSGNSTL
eukprot:1918120-Amphidinium_carterae.1